MSLDTLLEAAKYLETIEQNGGESLFSFCAYCDANSGNISPVINRLRHTRESRRNVSSIRLSPHCLPHLLHAPSLHVLLPATRSPISSY